MTNTSQNKQCWVWTHEHIWSKPLSLSKSSLENTNLQRYESVDYVFSVLICFFRSVMSFVECSMVETHTSTHSQIQLFIKRPWGGAPPILEISVFHISVDCKCSLIFFHFIQWQTAKSAPLTISQINKLTNIFTPFQQNVPSIYGPSWPRVGVGLNLNRLHNTKRRNISAFTPTGNLFSPDIQF